jgi:hypothetical protein
MGNIKNFNFNKLDLKLSNSDYWDFFLATDEYNNCGDGPPASGDCFVVWYDFDKIDTYANQSLSATSIYSLVTWNGATNTGYTFDTIGLTGIDNGLITFDKDPLDTSNLALLNALTGSTLIIPSGDKRLQMTRVTGTTGQYIYPYDIMIDGSGKFTNLCGGFYQGYYKIDGYSYEVLPTRVNNAWAAEFWVKPQVCCSQYTGTTLNDVYPDNKGFFFYMGTRAENKFWNVWEGADTGCTRDCTVPAGCTDELSEWCTIPKESEISIIGDYGVAIPLDPPQVEIDLVTNPFLIYGRACEDGYQTFTASSSSFLVDEDGGYIVSEDNNYIQTEQGNRFMRDEPLSATTSGDTCSCSCGKCGVCKSNGDGLGSKTVCEYDGKGIVVVKTAERVTNKQNPFLIYGRARTSTSSNCNCSRCSGPNDGLGNQTVCSFSGLTEPITELDNQVDVIDNAIGFRIKDDGSIGYRLLSYTGQCITASTGERKYVSGVTIEEGYSEAGAVIPNEWSYIVIKYVMENKTDCELKTAKPRKGKLMFYVNGKLKYVVNEFDEFIARRLNEYKDKQIGVPFNFSLGGGSQGLIESQTFDGLDPNDRDLLIEQNFAGTFLGGISQFKFNICDLTYGDIQNNYNTDLPRYTTPEITPSLLVDENGNYIISEDGFGVLVMAAPVFITDEQGNYIISECGFRIIA